MYNILLLYTIILCKLHVVCNVHLYLMIITITYMDMVGRLCSPFLVDTCRMKKEIFQPYIVEICAYLSTHQKKFAGEHTHVAGFSFIFKDRNA